MNASLTSPTSRRDFLKATGRFTADSTLAGTALPLVHAAGGDTLQVALIGCGGRGTGAAANALATRSGPIKLVAMADVFTERLDRSYETLKGAATKTAGTAGAWTGGFAASQVEVTPERRFLGFDAYQKAMDYLKWDHLTDAIRNDKPYNEVRRGAEASLVVLMGRRAVHTGQIVTFDDMLNCDEEFAPGLDTLAMDFPAPLPIGSDGRYPMPQPGVKKTREY